MKIALFCLLLVGCAAPAAPARSPGGTQGAAGHPLSNAEGIDLQQAKAKSALWHASLRAADLELNAVRDAMRGVHSEELKTRYTYCNHAIRTAIMTLRSALIRLDDEVAEQDAEGTNVAYPVANLADEKLQDIRVQWAPFINAVLHP